MDSRRVFASGESSRRQTTQTNCGRHGTGRTPEGGGRTGTPGNGILYGYTGVRSSFRAKLSGLLFQKAGLKRYPALVAGYVQKKRSGLSLDDRNSHVANLRETFD